MKNENNLKKTIPITSIPTPSIWSRMLIGGVSASIAQTFCHPIETIKVRLQNETKCTQKIYKNFPNTARVIIKNEGLFGLWRGMAPSLIREMSYSSLRFGLFVPIRNLIDRRFNNYPLESYVTHMSHRNLQGAPTESSENLTKGQIPLQIRKDNCFNLLY